MHAWIHDSKTRTNRKDIRLEIKPFSRLRSRNLSAPRQSANGVANEAVKRKMGECFPTFPKPSSPFPAIRHAFQFDFEKFPGNSMTPANADEPVLVSSKTPSALQTDVIRSGKAAKNDAIVRGKRIRYNQEGYNIPFQGSY